MTDVVVVGAGGGGPVVAKELAERGIRVLMLEAGPWPNPDTDFSRLEDDMNSIVDGRLRWGPADRTRGPWVRRRDGAGVILQAAGVGGTTLHYNAIAPRAYPQSFTAGWPFPYEHLVPWYERVEAFLPVVPVADLALKELVFVEGCEKTGLRRSDAADCATTVWRPARNAILPIAPMKPGAPLRYPEADGCTMCGHCIQGCPNPLGAPLERKAKRATNVSYVPAAVATGNCEIVPNAFATRILFERGDGRARVRGVRWRDTQTGEEREEESSVVVLAGGSIESPRLWLNSGLPNANDAAGRYFTMHLQDLVTGFFDREINPDVGQVTMARADFPGYGTLWVQGVGPQAFAAAVAGIGRGFWDEDAGGAPWDFKGRFYGAEAMRTIAEYSRSLTIVVSTDDEAVASNRIALDPDWPADEHGRVPRVVYRPTPESTRRQEWLVAKAAEILRAAGASRVHRTDPEPFVTHLMSTMRIGADPKTSMFDPGGEAHEVERLFVGDCSALPNALGGPNPTLTAQALAARTASTIADRYFA